MFVKSNIGLCAREGGRTAGGIVGVTPIIEERALVSKEQLSNLLIGESTGKVGVIDSAFVLGMFASQLFDLLTAGVKLKALLFEVKGEVSRAHLLREYIDHPGALGWYPLVRDWQYSSPETLEMKVLSHNRDIFELEVSSSYGPLVVIERHVIPVPYSIRTGRGLLPHEREQVLLDYAVKNPPETQPHDLSCELRQEIVSLVVGGRYHDTGKDEAITMYYIS